MDAEDNANLRPRTDPLRFKQRDSNTQSTQNRKHHSSSSENDNQHHQPRYRHRHRHRRYKSPKRDAAPLSPSLNPDAAFRESLFDALGDDEGAAYWEGVYGQPIHTYPSTRPNAATGELEQMTDEEYTAFVRRKMWEKSYEGVEAEREERRKRKREEDLSRKRAKTAPHRDDFNTAIEQSLRRGEERRRHKWWKERWKEYHQAWTDLETMVSSHKAGGAVLSTIPLRDKIPWPVDTGNRDHIHAKGIESFIRNGATALGDGDEANTKRSMMIDALKIERVRWHPDKMQQRYGAFAIDVDTRKGITAVFQLLDQMWNKEKTDGDKA